MFSVWEVTSFREHGSSPRPLKTPSSVCMVHSWAKGERRLGRQPPFAFFGLYGVKGTNLRLTMRRCRFIELSFFFFFFFWCVICGHIPSCIQLIYLTLCLFFLCGWVVFSVLFLSSLLEFLYSSFGSFCILLVASLGVFL